MTQRTAPARNRRRGVLEVAAAFLRLGLHSFGGPVAHVGYFRREFVERRAWLEDQHFARLLALCQLLPGPASSQLGFSIGMLRAGWPGAVAAFLGFTLPSALLLFGFALWSARFTGPAAAALSHGLELVAVAVVAQGVVAMAARLTPDRRRALLAIAAALATLAVGGPWLQLLLVAGGAAAGPWACPEVAAPRGASLPLRYGRRTGLALLAAFGLLLALAILAAPSLPPSARVAAAFYRAGALVFGGGHVVLPMLQRAVVDPGWVTDRDFLAGYGAAQAVPGPMFTLAAFLGERLRGAPGGAQGAATALAAIFLPGLLLVAGALPFWRALASRAAATRALAGVNAVVVGLLAAALYDPVWNGAVHRPLDAAIALIAFAMLALARLPVPAAVLWCVGAALLARLQ